jgi:acetyl-CoA C-acetyltransferase
MWADVVAAAAIDAGGRRLLGNVDSLTTTYCQTWQYDDPVGRLADELRITPTHRHYQPIGGTSGQQLVDLAARRIRDGESDVVAIASAESLATHAAARKRGERRTYRFKPVEKRPFPFEAPLHPQEWGHDLVGALNPFAMFDSARRAHHGIELEDHRRALAETFARMSRVAAEHPDSWFPIARSADDIRTPRLDNRMTAYPYTKYMVAVMDVDMAAAIIVTSDAAADRLGVPTDRRVYLRGSSYLTDATYVAQHRELFRSPAMAAASADAMRQASVDVDEVAYFDLYSCFGSSIDFARDALGLHHDDPRELTVVGGLPYHGGPGSGYMVHSIAEMTRRLRDDRSAVGMVSGVGMINTKHAFGIYGATPSPSGESAGESLQRALDSDNGEIGIVEDFSGTGTIAAYTVVHGRDGAATHGIAVVDIGPNRRAYARFEQADELATAERMELVGATCDLTPHSFSGILGEVRGHLARLH